MPSPSATLTGGRSACSALLLLVALFCVDTSEALDWKLQASAGLAAPVGPLDSLYTPSPTASAGISATGGPLTYRAVATYTGLVGRIYGGTVHHGAITLDCAVHGAFGVDRLSIFGGGGLAARRLREGRFLNTSQRINGVEVYGLDHVAVDARVVDLVGRLGLGYDLVRRSRWKLAGEIAYHGTYSLIVPVELELDVRADETITFGIVLTTDI